MGKKRNLPLIDGHKKGAKVIEKILEKALEVDIKYLTFYSFSTENWNRSYNRGERATEPFK